MLIKYENLWIFAEFGLSEFLGKVLEMVFLEAAGVKSLELFTNSIQYLPLLPAFFEVMMGVLENFWGDQVSDTLTHQTLQSWNPRTLQA